MEIGSNKLKQLEGVWYLPRIPWLDISGPELVQARLEAKDPAEAARLDALITDHVKVKIQPLSGDDYNAARIASKHLQQKATVKGATIHFGDDALTKEVEFAAELVAKRIVEVRDLVVVEEQRGADGQIHEVKTQVLTGEQLVKVLRREMSAEAMAIIEDLHRAIKEQSHLEKGVGEVSPLRSAS